MVITTVADEILFIFFLFFKDNSHEMANLTFTENHKKNRMLSATISLSRVRKTFQISLDTGQQND